MQANATMEAPRSPATLLLVGFAIAVAAVGGWARPVHAQQAPAASGPQVLVTPYLWLSGIDTAIKTPLPRAPEVNSDVGAFQLLGHLDGVPFMGSAEIRDGPFSLLGDVIHVPVGTSITTRNVFYQGGNAALRANTGTAILFYHVLDQPAQALDMGGGFRAWGFSTS